MKLLQNIKAQLPQLEQLLAETEDHWGIEDGVYRFYHQSFKVYYLQHFTEEIRKRLAGLLPDRPIWPAPMAEQTFTNELARKEAAIRSGTGQTNFSLLQLLRE